MRTMRKLDGLLADTSKGCKDWSITPISFLLLTCSSDSIRPKALQHMHLELGCCCTVLRVLIAPNATTSFAFCGGTFEIVILSSIIISNVDRSFEEAVDWGTPGFLEMGWIVVDKMERIPKWWNTYLVCHCRLPLPRLPCHLHCCYFSGLHYHDL